MSMKSWCKSSIGLKRLSNQDSYVINQDFGLYAIADGMGGHSGGEVASALAIEALESVIMRPPNFDMKPKDIVARAYSEASHRIYDKAAYERPELMGMGTTLVALYRVGASLFICNVGDSRCYLFRKPHLWQLTEDHSLVNEQIRAGLITENQLETFTSKNIITRCVGYERNVQVDVLERPLTKGDIFLLCSDGLSSMVADEQIEKIMIGNSVENMVDACVERALQNGGNDNVTVMIVSVD